MVIRLHLPPSLRIDVDLVIRFEVRLVDQLGLLLACLSAGQALVLLAAVPEFDVLIAVLQFQKVLREKKQEISRCTQSSSLKHPMIIRGHKL